MVILLDAANTIIHKPSFHIKFIEVLWKHGINYDSENFLKIHKVVSEYYHFPDKTSEGFYKGFNRELLYALGIIADAEILDDLFKACSYLPWEPFNDTNYISKIPVKKAILSNFHNGLRSILENIFNDEFAELIISEKENLRKPDLKFFQKAIDKLMVDPSEIIYIGDSIKLDLEPALKVGMNAWLIDRNNYFPSCLKRITSLQEINKIIEFS